MDDEMLLAASRWPTWHIRLEVTQSEKDGRILAARPQRLPTEAKMRLLLTWSRGAPLKEDKKRYAIKDSFSLDTGSMSSTHSGYMVTENPNTDANFSRQQSEQASLQENMCTFGLHQKSKNTETNHSSIQEQVVKSRIQLPWFDSAQNSYTHTYGQHCTQHRVSCVCILDTRETPTTASILCLSWTQQQDHWFLKNHSNCHNCCRKRMPLPAKNQAE